MIIEKQDLEGMIQSIKNKYKSVKKNKNKKRNNKQLP